MEGESNTEFCLYRVEGSKREIFVLLVRAWELDKDDGFLVTVCSRDLVCSSTRNTTHIMWS